MIKLDFQLAAKNLILTIKTFDTQNCIDFQVT